MSVYKPIRQALETHLTTLEGLPNKIFWENIKNKEVHGQEYLKTSFIPIDRYAATRGVNPQQKYEGVFRVSVYCLENEGPDKADTYADIILEGFNTSSDINNFVPIERSNRSRGITLEPFYKVDIDIFWYKYN